MEVSSEDVAEEVISLEHTVDPASHSEPAILTPLIEGLPDSISFQCLARVPLYLYPVLERVSQSWKSAIRSPELFRARKVAGVWEEWLYVSAYEPDRVWQAYDPLSDHWTTLPPLPSAIKHLTNFGTASVNGKLYVIGGGSDDVDPQTGDWDTTFSTSEVWRFDPIIRRWEQRSPLITARAQFACCVLDQKIVVAGGFTKTRKSIGSAEVYDPEKDAWTSLAEMSHIQNAACSGVVLEGRMHVVHKGFTVTQIYEPTLNRWVVTECGWPWGKMAMVKDELYVVFHGVVSREHKLPAFRKGLSPWPDCLHRIGIGATGLGDDLYVVGGIMSPRPHMLDIVHLNDVDICNIGSVGSSWRKGASMTVCKGTVLGCVTLRL